MLISIISAKQSAPLPKQRSSAIPRCWQFAGMFSKHAVSWPVSSPILRQRKASMNLVSRSPAHIVIRLSNPIQESTWYRGRSLTIARESGYQPDKPYPFLVQCQVDTNRSDPTAAERKFHEVEQKKLCLLFLTCQEDRSHGHL